MSPVNKHITLQTCISRIQLNTRSCIHIQRGVSLHDSCDNSQNRVRVLTTPLRVLAGVCEFSRACENSLGRVRVLTTPLRVLAGVCEFSRACENSLGRVRVLKSSLRVLRTT